MEKFLLKKTKTKFLKFITLKVIFPNWYRWCAHRKLVENKIVFVEVRLPNISNSFQLIYQVLKNEYNFDIKECFLHNGFVRGRKYFLYCLLMIREIATAKYVFLNETTNVLGACPIRNETKIIQLWHGCGAFKKFGFSTADLIFGEDKETQQRYPSHNHNSLVTVSSPDVIWAYAEAMQLEHKKEVIKPLGISRTDIFFDDGVLQRAQEKLNQLVPEVKGKKILLYAPTFRGRVAEAVAPEMLDFAMMKKFLADEFILLVKHHPLIKHRPVIKNEISDFVFDITEELTIEEVLCVADVCISDYSSLVFEYSLFERPMLFFAYDLDDYIDWRGFYYPYEDFVPGPIVTTTEMVIEYLMHLERFDLNRVKIFKKKFMSACDGHATSRILQEVFGEDLGKYKKIS